MGKFNIKIIIGFGALVAAAAIAVPPALIINLGDKRKKEPPKNPEFYNIYEYNFRGTKFSASEFADFLVRNKYVIDNRTTDGSSYKMIDGRKLVYDFYNNENTFIEDFDNRAKLLIGDEWLFDEKEKKAISNPIQEVWTYYHDSSDTFRIFIDGEEYSWREYDGDPTPTIGNNLKPKLVLIKETDITNKVHNPAPFVASDNMIYADGQFFTNIEAFRNSKLPLKLLNNNRQIQNISTIFGNPNRLFKLDAKSYLILGNGQAIRIGITTDIPEIIDLDIKNLKYVDNKNFFWSSIYEYVRFNSDVIGEMIASTSPQKFFESLNWDRIPRPLKLKNIIIDDEKYEGFDYLPNLDLKFNPGWYKTEVKPSTSTIFDETKPLYFSRWNKTKSEGQFILYSSIEKLMAAEKLSKIDPKYKYLLNEQPVETVVKPLVSVKLPVSDLEGEKRPIVQIDGELVYVSTTTTEIPAGKKKIN